VRCPSGTQFEVGNGKAREHEGGGGGGGGRGELQRGKLANHPGTLYDQKRVYSAVCPFVQVVLLVPLSLPRTHPSCQAALFVPRLGVNGADYCAAQTQEVATPSAEVHQAEESGLRQEATATLQEATATAAQPSADTPMEGATFKRLRIRTRGATGPNATVCFLAPSIAREGLTPYLHLKPPFPPPLLTAAQCHLLYRI